MLNMAKRDMLKRPSVQQVVVRVRLKLCGHRLYFSVSSNSSADDSGSGARRGGVGL